ncbi:uroporphyrinogen-III synthase [Sphingobium ummariense]
MKPLVILRPEPGAGRTAARAEALGLSPLRVPLFEAEPLPWQAPPAGQFDALLVTSAQTARLANLGPYRALPAYAVGEATADALRQAGFPRVTAGDGDGSAIAAWIVGDGHDRVLHLAGESVAPIEGRPLRIMRIPVYRMRPTDAAALEESLPDVAVLLVHSPRAGARLATLVPEAARMGKHIVAISPAALAACGGGWASAVSAERPADDRMLALAARLCEGLSPYGGHATDAR